MTKGPGPPFLNILQMSKNTPRKCYKAMSKEIPLNYFHFQYVMHSRKTIPKSCHASINLLL